MKTHLTIILAVIFALGMTTSAFAIHAEIPAETQAIVAKGNTQITLGGQIRLRGNYQEADFDSDTDPIGNYDGRVVLGVNAKIGDNVQGQLTLMSGDPKSSDPDTDANFGWGTENAMQGSLRINQAWILYTYKMAGIKVGHMPLALGNKIWFDWTYTYSA